MATDRSRAIHTQAPRRRGSGGGGLRIGRLLALIGIAVLAVLVLGGVAWGTYAWLTRPAAVIVTVDPKDARVVVVGPSEGKTRTWEGAGQVVVSPATAGANYLVTVSRAGYSQVKPFSVKPKAGEQIDKQIKLRLLPVTLELSVKPQTAVWTVQSADGGAPLSGTGPSTQKVTPGKYTVSVTSPGSQPYKKELTLDPGKNVTFTAWLDPSGQLVHKIMVFDTVPAPKGVAITPDNKQVWVTALVTQPSIGVYDPYTGKLIHGIDLGKNGGVEVIFNKAGTKAYVSQMQSASVFEIDTKTYKVLRQLMTKSVWTKVIELSPDEKTLYAANWVGNDVSIIDLTTGKLVKNVPTVQTPRGLYPTPDGKRLFVAGFGEKDFVGRLAVIDLATKTSKTFMTQKHGAMRHMVADPRTNRLYTSDMGQSVVWVTDMTTLKTTLLTRVDSHPNTIALSPDGKILFVSCRGANNPQGYNNKGPEWGTILIFDAATGKPLDAIIAGNQSTALALSDDGKLLVGSDFLDNKARSYEIPPSDVLIAGDGGLYPNHKSLLVRPGWENRWTVGSDVHRIGAAAGEPGTAAN